MSFSLVIVLTIWRILILLSRFILMRYSCISLILRRLRRGRFLRLLRGLRSLRSRGLRLLRLRNLRFGRIGVFGGTIRVRLFCVIFSSVVVRVSRFSFLFLVVGWILFSSARYWFRSLFFSCCCILAANFFRRRLFSSFAFGSFIFGIVSFIVRLMLRSRRRSRFLTNSSARLVRFVRSVRSIRWT